MTNTGSTPQHLFCGKRISDPSHALSRKAMGILCGLTLFLTLGGGCTALRSPCLQKSRPAHAPDHDGEARSYREAALRMLADSSRHSALAVQYAEQAAGGSDASLWRDLAEYHLRLASYELSAASLMVAIAMVHWQLAYGSQPSGKAEGSP